MALQIRRGPTLDRAGNGTPAYPGKIFLEGELVYDTDLKALYVGDGNTLGGVSASTYTDIQSVNAIGSALDNGTHSNISFTYTDDTINAVVTLDGGLLNVVDDTTPQLGGNLDLNNKTINGTGTINFTGTVTATGFTGPLTGQATSVLNGIYTGQKFFIGTTEIDIQRSSATLALTGTSIDGNAATATKLAATKNIQGVAFDGSADITVVTQGTGVTVTGTEVKIGQAVATTSDVTFNDVTVSGNLTVNGTTTTLNTATLDIEDLNITVAKGASNAAAANGAGLTVDGASATLLYASTGDKFVFNKSVDATGFNGNLTGTIQTAAQANITSVGTLTGLTSSGIVTVNYTGNANSSVVIGGSNTRGGAGFHDFLKVTNGAIGATNNNKHFRLTSTGTLEIISSNYGATILSLTDIGELTTKGLTINGSSFINTTTTNPLTITVNDSLNNVSKNPNLVLTTIVNSNTVGSGPAVQFNVQLDGFAQPLVQVGRLESISDGDTGSQFKFINNNGLNPGGTEITTLQIGTGAVVAFTPLVSNTGILLMTPNTVASSIGLPGDVPGVVKMDTNYFYYCFGEYDGVTNIWKRTPWGSTW
jgi:hypothetical protein